MVTLSKADHNNNQYSELHRALTLDAGKFDKDSEDVVKLLKSNIKLPTVRKTILELHTEVNDQYYKR